MSRVQAWNARLEAANACVERFGEKPFAWGKADCVRVAAFLLKQRGHTVALSKVGSYSTEAGALRALRKLGFKSLIAAMDAQGFPRIAPASALPGDLVALEAPEPWGGSLAVKLSGSLVLGTVSGSPWCALEMLKPVAAWRID